MDIDQQEFLDSAAPLLGWFYVTAGVMNVGAVWRHARPGRQQLPSPVSGEGPGVRGAGRQTAMLLSAAGFAVVWLVIGSLCFAGQPLEVPPAIKHAIDAALSPASLFLGSLGVLAAFYVGWRRFVIPAVAWTILNASLLFFGASLADRHFAAIVLQPDNVPIVAMVYLLGFFLWLGAAQAVENDRHLRVPSPSGSGQDGSLPSPFGRGEGEGLAPSPATSGPTRPGSESTHPSPKAQLRGKTLVWPDLVYIELIAMLLLSAGLIAWSLVLRAPLEQPANPAFTPNPSKAPWFFLGLQELLVYFNPAMAGVVIPGLIVFGLMAIPYLDSDPRGSGLYTIRGRRFGYAVFLFGFLQLWVLLILVGTFFRGPDWRFCGLYGPRDPEMGLGSSVLGLAASTRSPEPWTIAWRGMPGLVVLASYFVALPLVLGRTSLRSLRRRLGAGRYWMMALLMLAMLAVPLKMLLHWTCNLN